MSIKNSDWPVYFHIPQSTVLSQELEGWETNEQRSLYGTVCQMAVSEGVRIEEWDQEWGRYHLFENDVRLSAAMIRQRTIFVQTRAGCSERVADLLMKQCPLVDSPALSSGVLQDLIQRGEFLDRLEKLKTGIYQKYPSLNTDGLRASGWKRKETFFLTLPVLLSEKERDQFEYFISVGEELIRGNYDEVAAGMILDRLLAKEARNGVLSELHDHLRLLVLKKTAREHIFNGTLAKAPESGYKDIFTLSSAVGRGKFKPLEPCSAAKEAYAWRCDRVLGIGMTAPTATISVRFSRSLLVIQDLFRSAAVLMGSQENAAAAQRLRERAFATLQASDFPETIRNRIFGEMYALCGEMRRMDDLGQKLMLHLDGYQTSDSMKALAVGNFMRSSDFQQQLENDSWMSGSLHIIQDLFRTAALIMQSQNHAATAQRLRERAFALLEADHFPRAVRNTIFGEMYVLCGKRRQVDDLGRKLMLHLDGYQASDCMKELAVSNSMRSPDFQEHLKNDSLMTGSLHIIQELFRSAAVLMESQANVDRAQRLRARAFTLLEADDFPQAVRNTIFGELYALCGERRQVDDLGRKLMLHLDGYQASDRQKELAVGNYMRSPRFQEHLNSYDSQGGSVQMWLSQCKGSGWDLIAKDPMGGRRLADAPKTLVHFYALLGMLKGSMDCMSNNTLIEWNEQESTVSHFWDMDDERSMPDVMSFWKIRLWQLGLPQCSMAFDRAFLLLFSDPGIARKLRSIQLFRQISDSAYGLQLERLHTVTTLFVAEVKKGEITLTPRDLYFRMFPGSKEEFDRATVAGGGERFVSPIELFGFYLSEWGMFHLSITGNPVARQALVDIRDSAEAIEQQKRFIDANLETLK